MGNVVGREEENLARSGGELPWKEVNGSSGLEFVSNMLVQKRARKSNQGEARAALTCSILLLLVAHLPILALGRSKRSPTATSMASGSSANSLQHLHPCVLVTFMLKKREREKRESKDVINLINLSGMKIL